MRFALRLCLVMALSLGLLLPRVSAVVGDLAGGSLGAVILCDGSGLVTLSLDGDGKQVPPLSHHAHCALLHAIGTGAPPPDLAWRLAEPTLAPVFVAVSLPRPADPRGPPGARAPPIPVLSL